jgi:hypothetical protein
MAMAPRQQQRQQAPAPPAGGGGGIPFAGMEGLLFELKNFDGINTRTARTSIKDEQYSWLENLMPIAEGNLRSLWSNAAPIYTAGGGKQIIYIKMFNIGAAQYAAVFLNDGTAYQVAMNGAVVPISAAPGTFYNGTTLPNAAQWGSSGLIIVGAPASGNGYWAWDGTLWPPGNATSPTWLNDGTPTAMPTGVAGTYVETFQSRAWVCNGTNLLFTAGGNGAQFAAGSGGGVTPATDSFLRVGFTAVKQANGYLYLFGDSSVNVISNVQTSASSVTTFNNQNTDPQVGTAWPASIVQWGRGLMFANATGVYLLMGGAVEKVSVPLDGLFLAAVFSPRPTAAIHYLYEVKCYCLTLGVLDLFGVRRMVVCCFNGERWFLASQLIEPVYIDLQEIDSVITAWGTDGNSLFQLFQTPSTSLSKILQSKLWQGDSYIIVKQALRLYGLGEDFSGNGYMMTGTLDMQSETGQATAPAMLASKALPVIWLNNSNQIVTWQNNSLQAVVFLVQTFTLFGQDQQGVAPLLGLTLVSMSSDFQISAITLLYRRFGPVGG